MRNYEDYYLWLSTNLNKENFSLGFIFGSVARNEKEPNDCDLFLVTKHKTNSELWKFMRNQNKTLKEKFYQNFNLELSIQLLTLDEFNEQSKFIKLTMKSPKIVIIDEMNLK